MVVLIIIMLYCDIAIVNTTEFLHLLLFVSSFILANTFVYRF